MTNTHWAPLIAACLGAPLVACDGGVSPTSTNDGNLILSLSPSSRASNLGDTHPSIAVTDIDEILSDERALSVIGAVSLTDSAGRTIAVTPRVRPVTGADDAWYRVIELEPDVDLANDWHHLTVTVAASEAHRLAADQASRLATTFHPGHAPFLSTVLSCPGDNGREVGLVFSEPVYFGDSGAQPMEVPFAVERNGVPCGSLGFRGPLLEDGTQAAARVTFDCRARGTPETSNTGEADVIRVTRTADIVGGDDTRLALDLASPETTTIELHAVDGVQRNDCVVWTDE